MASVAITIEAERELRERIASSRDPAGVMIVPGPLHEDYRGPESPEEEWIINPPQRWHARVTPLEFFASLTEYPEMFRVLEVGGITVGLFAPHEPKPLRIELDDDAIRVRESAA